MKNWEIAGMLACHAMATRSLEELAVFLKNIHDMKRNAENPHRPFYAYLGYCQFVELHDREPTKLELRYFISECAAEWGFAEVINNPKAASDWEKEMWNPAGLSGLKNR